MRSRKCEGISEKWVKIEIKEKYEARNRKFEVGSEK